MTKEITIPLVFDFAEMGVRLLEVVKGPRPPGKTPRQLLDELEADDPTEAELVYRLTNVAGVYFHEIIAACAAQVEGMSVEAEVHHRTAAPGTETKQ